MIAHLIRSLATTTTYCERHGDVVEVHRTTANVIERGYYMAVDAYVTTFEDGYQRTFWLRGYKPLPI